MTLVSKTQVADAVYDQTRQHFSGTELVKLTLCAAAICAWNRIAISFTRGGTLMTILTPLHVIRLLALGMLLILPATSGAQQRPPILEKLTKTYGLDSFGQIEAIRYTFNAQAQDSISPNHGPGSRKPTRSPMRGRTSRASR